MLPGATPGRRRYLIAKNSTAPNVPTVTTALRITRNAYKRSTCDAKVDAFGGIRGMSFNMIFSASRPQRCATRRATARSRSSIQDTNVTSASANSAATARSMFRIAKLYFPVSGS